MLGDVFERFVEKSPISVMVRGTLERVLGPDPLDLWYERTAKKQYTRALLFSTVYDLMSQVVFRLQPSVHEEHSVILTLFSGTVDDARTPDRRSRYTWRSAGPTSHCY